MKLADLKKTYKVESFNEKGTTVVFLQNLAGVASLLLDNILYRIENLEGSKIIVLVDKQKVTKQDTVQGSYNTEDIGKLRRDVIRNRYYGQFTTEIYTTVEKYATNRQLMGGEVNLIVYNFQQGEEDVNEGNTIHNIGLSLKQNNAQKLKQRVYNLEGVEEILHVKSCLYFINVQVGALKSAVVLNYADGLNVTTLQENYYNRVSVPLKEKEETKLEATDGYVHAIELTNYLTNIFNAIVTNELGNAYRIAYIKKGQDAQKERFKGSEYPILLPNRNFHIKEDDPNSLRYKQIEAQYEKHTQSIKAYVAKNNCLRNIHEIMQVERYLEQEAVWGDEVTSETENDTWNLYKNATRLLYVCDIHNRGKKVKQFIEKQLMSYSAIANATPPVVEEYSKVTGKDGEGLQKKIQEYTENLKTILKFYHDITYKNYQYKEDYEDMEMGELHTILKIIQVYSHPKYSNSEQRYQALKSYIEKNVDTFVGEGAYESVQEAVKIYSEMIMEISVKDTETPLEKNLKISTTLKSYIEKIMETYLTNTEYLNQKEYREMVSVYAMLYMENLIYNFYLKEASQQMKELQV